MKIGLLCYNNYYSIVYMKKEIEDARIEGNICIIYDVVEAKKG